MNKPIISRQISAGTRVYYIDVHKDHKGQKFISMSEIPTDRMPGEKRRQRIFLYGENIEQFAKAFDEVAQFIKDESDERCDS